MGNSNNVYNIEGFRMHLDSKKRGITSVLLAQGYREPAFMWILRNEAKGHLGLDLGANIGYATLSLCKNMKKVIAIEPDKRCRKLLKRSLRDNNFDTKTEICNFAVSDENGEKDIWLAKKNFNLNSLCGTSIVKSKKDKFIKSTIKTVKIDSLNIDPNFIKMDIEGYEVEALRGARETLSRSKFCKILIEVHPQFYNKDRDLSFILNEIVDFGFVIKYVVSAGSSCPDLFKEKGYKPFKSFKDGEHERGLFSDIDTFDAIKFASFPHSQKNPKTGKVSKKIVRSILLVKE